MINTRARQARKIVARFALIIPCGLGAALPAHATLGGIEASVFADQSQISATLRTMPNARYTIHELRAPSGTVVREYVAPTGIVFAVAWQGPAMPDLRQVLGAHFDEYVAAVAASHNRRGPVSVQLPGLVVQSGGHMRGFIGKAYVPETLPPGVSLDDVR
ncbi:MAG TPA: DUF2844 domain-containing protein [Casimicrobiaceae bacterium]